MRVPIYGLGLEAFKRPDKQAEEFDFEVAPRPGGWRTSYEQRDEARGIGWKLRVKDFQRYADEGHR